MPPLVLEEILRKPLEEKLRRNSVINCLFSSLEPVSQLHVDSQQHVRAPDLVRRALQRCLVRLQKHQPADRLVQPRRQQPPTASRSHRPALVCWPARVCSAGEKIGRFPCNLPAQLFTSCGLPLSHELLYSKAKLSS